MHIYRAHKCSTRRKMQSWRCSKSVSLEDGHNTRKVLELEAKLLVEKTRTHHNQWHCIERQGIIIPYLLQRQILEQLQNNHMSMRKHTSSQENQGIGPTWLITLSRLWYSVPYDKNTMHIAAWTALHYDMPYKAWDVAGTGIFMINNNSFSLLLIITVNSQCKKGSKPISKCPCTCNQDDICRI